MGEQLWGGEFTDQQKWVSSEEWQHTFGRRGPVFIITRDLVNVYGQLFREKHNREEATQEAVGEVYGTLRERYPALEEVSPQQLGSFLALASLLPNVTWPVIRKLVETENEGSFRAINRSLQGTAIKPQANGVVAEMPFLLVDPLRELGLQLALDKPRGQWRRRVAARAEALIPEGKAGAGDLNWLRTAVIVEMMDLMNREENQRSFAKSLADYFSRFAQSSLDTSKEGRLIEKIKGISYTAAWLLGDRLFFQALSQSGYSDMVLRSLDKQLSQLEKPYEELVNKNLRQETRDVVKNGAINAWCYFVAGQSVFAFWRLTGQGIRADNLNRFAREAGFQLGEIAATIRQLYGKEIGPYGSWDGEETEEAETDSADRAVRMFKALAEVEGNIFQQAPPGLLASLANERRIFYPSGPSQIGNLAYDLFWQLMPKEVWQLARGVHTNSHAVISLFQP